MGFNNCRVLAQLHQRQDGERYKVQSQSPLSMTTSTNYNSNIVSISSSLSMNMKMNMKSLSFIPILPVSSLNCQRYSTQLRKCSFTTPAYFTTSYTTSAAVNNHSSFVNMLANTNSNSSKSNLNNNQVDNNTGRFFNDDEDELEDDDDADFDDDNDEEEDEEALQPPIGSVKSTRSIRPSSGRSALVDEPDENDDDMDDVDEEAYNPLGEQMGFSEEAPLEDDDTNQQPPIPLNQKNDDDDDDDLFTAEEGDTDVENPDLLDDAESEEDIQSAAELLSERGVLGLGVGKEGREDQASVRDFALNFDEVVAEDDEEDETNLTKKKNNSPSKSTVDENIAFTPFNSPEVDDDDDELNVFENEDDEDDEDIEDIEENSNEQGDDIGLTSRTKFGRVWELNEDSYVTITERGEPFSYELDVEDQEDQDMASMRRGKQGGWNGGLASYPASDLPKGSREWVARKSYEFMTSASYKHMYRWTKWHDGPPPQIDDLYPTDPPPSTPVGVCSLTMSTPPPVGALVGHADASMGLNEDEDIDEAYNIYDENNNDGMESMDYNNELNDDDNDGSINDSKQAENQKLQRQLVDEQIEGIKEKIKNEGNDDSIVSVGGAKISTKKEKNSSTTSKAKGKRRTRTRDTDSDSKAPYGYGDNEVDQQGILERSVKFPCNYKFKIEGEIGNNLLPSLKEITEEITGRKIPDSAVSIEPAGRYQRVTLLVDVESARQVTELYDALRSNPLVKFSYG